MKKDEEKKETLSVVLRGRVDKPWEEQPAPG